MNRELLEYVRGLERRIGALERQERAVPVVAVYTTAAGQNIPHITMSVIDYNNKVIDTHNAVSSGSAWKFVAPLPGQYLVYAVAQFAPDTGWAETEVVDLVIFRNGSAIRRIDYRFGQNTGGLALRKLAGGGASVSLASGDEINVRIYQSSGATMALDADSNVNHISIFRIH